MSKDFVEFADGQRLYYQIYGSGRNNIMLLHGLVGGSWLSEEWITTIESSDVCCIVPERPGYGDSSAIEFNSVSDWIPIAQALIKRLCISSMDVIGCSAGGPYAYATALALPVEVQKIYILDGVPAVYEEKVLRHYDEVSQTTYRGFAEQPQSAVQEYYIAQMEGAQQRLASSNLEYVKKTLEEVLAQRCFGMAQESRLQILPWKLPLERIKQPITLYHAPVDEMVPYNAAKEMVAFLDNCKLCDVDVSTLPQGQSAHMLSISQSFCKIINSIGINT